MHFRHRAGGDVEHRHLRHAPHAVDVEKRDALAVRRPRRPLWLRRQVRHLTALSVLAGPHVADPKLQVLVVLVGGVDELRAVGRPRGIGVEREVPGDVHRLATNRHDVDVADRREGDLFSVGRDHGAHDAKHRSRHGRREVALPMRICRLRARYLHGRAELDGLRIPAVGAASPDLSVRHVEELCGRGPIDPGRPRRAESKHVLPAGNRLPADFIAALPRRGHVVHDLTVGPPRRRIDASARA